MTNSRVAMIERLLTDSLRRDRAKPSRCDPQEDGTTIVRVSGRTVGLVYALSLETGETDDEILRRFDD